MFLKLAPLLDREYRLLYVGQTISFFGSMLTYVAIPYQVYELSHSAWYVGLLGVVQLVPLLIAALLGGAMADALDRRLMVVVSELMLALCSAVLLLNAHLMQPSLAALFAVSAAMSAVNGFHRPALDAMTQRLVAYDDQAAAAALGSLRFSIGSIVGPACAGRSLRSSGSPPSTCSTLCHSAAPSCVCGRWPRWRARRPPLAARPSGALPKACATHAVAKS